MTDTQSFVVYLTDAVGPDIDDSPIRADDVDFYDSGVWVSHDGERDFFPYRRIVRIREHPAAQSTGERRDAASGSAGAVDDTDLDVD